MYAGYNSKGFDMGVSLKKLCLNVNLRRPQAVLNIRGVVARLVVRASKGLRSPARFVGDEARRYWRTLPQLQRPRQ